MWEHKYEQKRKALKEAEQSYGRQSVQSEKEIAVLSTKVDQLEETIAKERDEYEEEIADMRIQLEESGSMSGHFLPNQDELNKLRQENLELDRQL
jgi:hypothetical protein